MYTYVINKLGTATRATLVLNACRDRRADANGISKYPKSEKN